MHDLTRGRIRSAAILAADEAIKARIALNDVMARVSRLKTALEAAVREEESLFQVVAGHVQSTRELCQLAGIEIEGKTPPWVIDQLSMPRFRGALADRSDQQKAIQRARDQVARLLSKPAEPVEPAGG